MVEITHNGLPSQSIKLAYEYLREAQGHSSGYAKKLFKEMEKPEKLATIATAEAWARANGRVLEPMPASKPRGRPPKSAPASSKAYSVILPVSDLEALKSLSSEQGESVSVLIRAAIRDYIRRQS
ncbi:ribbon-helix-helix domain-containing protein [Agitococcus lubricus]|uniref:ribbon-helix-helix domain-containing protein n=1 Tax=Agitococcus lubricus TaxID=1077255 RepID=UPI000D302C19|nr:ribbon-helix-helix domain-containing protein [Agitococcus lubricus]